MTRQQQLDWELRVSALLGHVVCWLHDADELDQIAAEIARLVQWRESWEASRA